MKFLNHFFEQVNKIKLEPSKNIAQQLKNYGKESKIDPLNRKFDTSKDDLHSIG